MFREPSLEDPLEDSFAQFEFDLDVDMVHEQAKTRTANGEEENEEQIKPLPILNWSNDKEVRTEAHPFITIPLETQQASFFQCLKEPSYVEIFKVSRTKRCKYRNRHNQENLLKKANFLHKMAEHPSRGVSYFKEERMEGIGSTPI